MTPFRRPNDAARVSPGRRHVQQKKPRSADARRGVVADRGGQGASASPDVGDEEESLIDNVGAAQSLSTSTVIFEPARGCRTKRAGSSRQGRE